MQASFSKKFLVSGVPITSFHPSLINFSILCRQFRKKFLNGFIFPLERFFNILSPHALLIPQIHRIYIQLVHLQRVVVVSLIDLTIQYQNASFSLFPTSLILYIDRSLPKHRFSLWIIINQNLFYKIICRYLGIFVSTRFFHPLNS